MPSVLSVETQPVPVHLHHLVVNLNRLCVPKVPLLKAGASFETSM